MQGLPKRRKTLNILFGLVPKAEATQSSRAKTEGLDHISVEKS
jgi:hypothetical protein